MQALQKLSLPLLIVSALASLGMQRPVPATHSAFASVPKSASHAAASRPQREIFGFALASSLNDPSVGYTTWNFGLLSTVAFFGLHVNDDGTFAGDSSWATWNNAAERTAFVNAAHAQGTRVVLTIVLQDFSAGTPHMCSGLAHWAATVGYAVSQVKAQGVDGLNVDYEGLNGACGTPDSSWARHAFTSFVGSLRSALPAGSYLSVDTYASSASDPIGFFDVQAMASTVDSFFVMAYDLEYSNYRHPPLNCSSFCLGPTAPLSGYYYNDTSTAAQYVAAVGPSKVILGVPYYGRKACVASTAPNQSPSGSITADGYLDAAGEAGYYLVQAGTYAAHRDANDPAGEERWDTWTNTSLNCTRELYWDDSTSLGLKYDLVNHDNLRGVGIWTLNYGGGASELWNQLAAHFVPLPSMPTNVSACAGPGSVTVSWSPATSPNGAITGYQVTANPGGASVTVGGNVTAATLSGLTAGAGYTFAVRAINSTGQGPAAASGSVTPVATTTNTSYFNWYDKATEGVLADTVHLLNPGTTDSLGCVTIAGVAVAPFGVAAGHDGYLTFPAGTRAGPVVVSVNSGPAVLVALRAWYSQSLNEIWGRSAAAGATSQYFPWYDLASPGMRAETIHIMNAGGANAYGTIALPGANSINFGVPPGVDAYYSFPAGTIGGPVSITSSQPVLASLRSFYYQSFNEVTALPASAAATVLYLPWYDLSSAGTVADTIHITNVSGTTATGTIALRGASSLSFSVLPGHDGYYSFPRGTIGGPVTITSSHPVVASLRAWYYQSFNETAARPAAAAMTVQRFAWYDLASPGMRADTVHITNVGTANAFGTIALAGRGAINFGVPPGSDAYYSLPVGSIGGPVTITSTQPVLASLRAWYYQSFNEISGA